MRLPFFIARRYLFAKKSHNVINIISIISASGIALGTTALIVILSVYNGFGDLIKTLYGAGEADILIAPAQGKSFRTDTISFQKARELTGDNLFCEVVTENVFVRYGNKEAVAEMKGVDPSFQENTVLRDFIIDGEFSLWLGEIPQAVAGRTLAQELGMRPHFTNPVTIFFPSRYASYSPINPLSSINKKNLSHSGTFAAERTMDKNLLFVPLSIARELVEMEDYEVSAIEIYNKGSLDAEALIPQLKKVLGDGYKVLDRYSQNETLYKMVKAEKFTIYIILLFIVIIISFNLYGSLSMLIIEKEDDSITLRSMGANERLIKKIFLYEGWMISILGMLIGIILGITICILQQKAGIVKMPGNFMMDAYPVVLKLWDIVAVAAGVSIVGYLSALLPLKNFK
ncbi:MAG: ABC transporter permease [Bacteroidales bacterium]|nr:ABC transporter permease [Bacteroidales bacterium]MDD3272565.1 ABC transporter permease [Bacteroidales bacterium]MDD4057688.1 ABC transporter permease [Bacteroidales bacterium]